MKTIFAILVLSFLFLGCQSESKQEENSNQAKNETKENKEEKKEEVLSPECVQFLIAYEKWVNEYIKTVEASKKKLSLENTQKLKEMLAEAPKWREDAKPCRENKKFVAKIAELTTKIANAQKK